MYQNVVSQYPIGGLRFYAREEGIDEREELIDYINQLILSVNFIPLCWNGQRYNYNPQGLAGLSIT